MDYDEEISLKQICLIKYVVILWNNYHETVSIDNDWYASEKQVLDIVDKLNIPVVLAKEIKIFVRIIGSEMHRFRIYNENIIRFHEMKFALSRLYWTLQGKVDYKKTQTLLIKEERLRIVDRYKIACNICEENYISEIWKNLTECDKNDLYGQRRDNLYLFNLWSLFMGNRTKILQDRIQWINPFDPNMKQCALFEAIRTYNREGIEYYFSKISFEQRVEALTKALKFCNTKRKNTYCSKYHKFDDLNFKEMLLFLFVRMSEEIMSVLKNRRLELKASSIIVCYLEWPYQRDFLTIASFLMEHVRKNDNSTVISSILSKITNAFNDYDYFLLLKGYWELSMKSNDKPTNKDRVVSFYAFLSNFDRAGAELILNYLNAIEREKAIFHPDGCNICVKLANQEEWNLLNCFVTQCLPKKKLEDFKKQFNCPESIKCKIFQYLDNIWKLEDKKVTRKRKPSTK